MSDSRSLGRGGQFRYGDLRMGILRMSTDPEDLWARIAVADSATMSRDTREVRVGDRVRFAGCEMCFSEVVAGSRDGYVAFTIEALRGGTPGGGAGDDCAGPR